MNLDEFLGRLHATPRTWTLRLNGWRFVIRNAKGRDPLAEVFSDSYYAPISAAEEAGLLFADAIRVAMCSDGSCEKDKELFVEIADACGLREVA